MDFVIIIDILEIYLNGPLEMCKISIFCNEKCFIKLLYAMLNEVVETGMM